MVDEQGLFEREAKDSMSRGDYGMAAEYWEMTGKPEEANACYERAAGNSER